jgi:hypothetical protein
MTTIRRALALLSATLLLVSALPAETLNLSPEFVNQCKNRATISINFELDAHLKTPHKISSSGDDGDIHMAGRAPEVKLPMVAEIMNAGLDDPPISQSLDLINQTAAGQSIPIVGVWRIWFEHPSTGDQTQGDEVGVPENSNPDHVFEIHPITKFGSNDIAEKSFVPIDKPNSATHETPEDYQAYAASKAFGAYEKLQATISVSDSAISITAKKAGYNYAEFLLEPVGKFQAGDDGTFVLANVYDVSDAENPVTAAPRRMVFVSNTEPEAQLQQLAQGQMMHVLGIPRVNLAEVAAVSGNDVDMALPYEMIVVAVFPDAQSSRSSGMSSGGGERPVAPTRRRRTTPQ